MDYFSVVRHSATNTIHLFLAVKGILHFTSMDGGESWQGPTELTGPAPWPHAPTVGHAVELASGALVVPACCSAGSCALISTDGKTWTVGGFGVKGSRESSIAEIDCSALIQHGSSANDGVAPSSCLYINARNMNKNAGGAPHGRFEAASTDGGVSWTNMTRSTTLTTPVTPHCTFGKTHPLQCRALTISADPCKQHLCRDWYRRQRRCASGCCFELRFRWLVSIRGCVRADCPGADGTLHVVRHWQRPNDQMEPAKDDLAWSSGENQNNAAL